MAQASKLKHARKLGYDYIQRRQD